MSKKTPKKDEPVLADELKPDNPDHVVATGDEENPVSGSNYVEDRKTIYAKARKNRELTQREEQDNMPSVKEMNEMVAEAADEAEFEHTAHDVDLEADARAEETEEEIEDAEYVETPTDDTLNQMADEAASGDDPIEEEEPEPQSDAEDGESARPKPDLDYEVNDGMVAVKVEGNEYIVPEADVIAAGSKAQYQKNRSANIRFESAATAGKALQDERLEFEQQQNDSPAKGDLPDKDDLSKAELRKFREKLLDASLDGTQDDVDEIVKEIIALRPAPEADNSTGNAEPRASDRIVNEFETAYGADRAEANRLLIDNYSDIMNDSDLRKIAESKYKELQASPNSRGRTAVEMARESGDFVRRISKAKSSNSNVQKTELENRRQRKRVLPQSSKARSTSKAPETKKPRSSREYIRDIQRRQGNRP